MQDVDILSGVLITRPNACPSLCVLWFVWFTYSCSCLSLCLASSKNYIFKKSVLLKNNITKNILILNIQIVNKSVYYVSILKSRYRTFPSTHKVPPLQTTTDLIHITVSQFEFQELNVDVILNLNSFTQPNVFEIIHLQLKFMSF